MSDSDDRPDVIAAKAAAREKILLARAKMHPVAQVIQTLLDALESFITNIGCFIVLVIIGLAIFAPEFLQWLMNLVSAS